MADSISTDKLVQELESEIEWLRARNKPDTWEWIFMRWLLEFDDELDFKQQRIPDRLRNLLEKAYSPSD